MFRGLDVHSERQAAVASCAEHSQRLLLFLHLSRVERVTHANFGQSPREILSTRDFSAAPRARDDHFLQDVSEGDEFGCDVPLLDDGSRGGTGAVVLRSVSVVHSRFQREQLGEEFGQVWGLLCQRLPELVVVADGDGREVEAWLVVVHVQGRLHRVLQVVQELSDEYHEEEHDSSADSHEPNQSEKK